MATRGTPFRGVLFAGLMITTDGPKLIEYNVRFGDPETQVLMMRLESDLLAALLATADGTLDGSISAGATRQPYRRDGGRRLSGHAEKGTEIRGLDEARKVAGVEIFHAGTRRDGDRLLADGGRVLNVTALGRDRRRGAGARLRGDCQDRLARRLLPPRHRLARGGPRRLARLSPRAQLSQ